MNYELYQSRSMKGSMKVAFLLMTSQWRRLLKKTWWAMALCALLLTATIYFLLPNKALHDWGVANPWPSFIIQTVVYACCLLSFIPASITMWQWLGGKQLHLWSAYKKWWKHIGGLLTLCLLGGLMTLTAICLVCQPAVILIVAQTVSQLGALDGDPLGLPAYFTPLLVAILFAACFLSLYIGYWLHIAVAFLMGSYEARERERKQEESRIE